VQRACERAAQRDCRADSGARLGNAALAVAQADEQDGDRVARPSERRNSGGEPVSAVSVKLTQIVPPMIVILLLIAIWWIVVVKNDSAIFPTPWQVVTGAFELAEDGTLWE